MHDLDNSHRQQSRSSFRVPRFSLFTLFLVVAILALAITVIRLWREVEPLRAVNKRLNEERGTLMVDDPSRLHAIRIPDRFAGEGRESYRVFVPKSSRYWVFLVVNNIAKEGYPKLKRYPPDYGTLGSGTNLPLFGRLDPGEHVVTVREVWRGDKRRDIQLIVDGLDVTANTRADEWPTATTIPYSMFGETVRSDTTPADAAGRLVLRRRRIEATSEERLHQSYATIEPDRPLDGFLLWIEPDPSSK